MFNLEQKSVHYQCYILLTVLYISLNYFWQCFFLWDGFTDRIFNPPFLPGPRTGSNPRKATGVDEEETRKTHWRWIEYVLWKSSNCISRQALT